MHHAAPNISMTGPEARSGMQTDATPHTSWIWATLIAIHPSLTTAALVGLILDLRQVRSAEIAWNPSWWLLLAASPVRRDSSRFDHASGRRQSVGSTTLRGGWRSESEAPPTLLCRYEPERSLATAPPLGTEAHTGSMSVYFAILS